ncbi:MAG: Nramp family divalent metal transporter, partial [Candidatus Limnocylindrales bacterium]
MPQLPTVRGVAKQAETGARRAVETWRHPTERRRRLPPRPPRIGLVSRLGDRIANREFLRLRGRFRGRRGLLAFLAVMGPGLIAGVAGNDAGGITTYSVMGAQTGLGLLWIFPITIIILVVVQEIAARLGVVTGQGLSDLIRDRFGVRWTAFAMLVLLVANLANTVAEFSGAAAALEIFGITRYLTVPLVAVAIWALVLFSSYRTVERVFLAIALVFITYIFSAVLAHPDWGQVGQALVTPNLNGLTGPILLLIVGVVGTTITPYMQFYLQSAVAEKGIGEDELVLEQVDSVGGAVWTNVIAVFIVIATALTIHAVGGTINSASDAALGLKPVAGNLAEVLFAVGLFGASVLAATIMPISTSFVICEAFGWESGVDKRFADARAFFSIYT